MSAKVLTTDSKGMPKTIFFNDVIDGLPIKEMAKPNSTLDKEQSLSDQARDRMIKRSQEAWKK